MKGNYEQNYYLTVFLRKDSDIIVFKHNENGWKYFLQRRIMRIRCKIEMFCAT